MKSLALLVAAALIAGCSSTAPAPDDDRKREEGVPAWAYEKTEREVINADNYEFDTEEMDDDLEDNWSFERENGELTATRVSDEYPDNSISFNLSCKSGDVATVVFIEDDLFTQLTPAKIDGGHTTIGAEQASGGTKHQSTEMAGVLGDVDASDNLAVSKPFEFDLAQFWKEKQGEYEKGNGNKETGNGFWLEIEFDEAFYLEWVAEKHGRDFAVNQAHLTYYYDASDQLIEKFKDFADSCGGQQ